MSTRFACDYAKRVSACKKCKLQLPKGEMRMAKITPNPFVQNADGPPPDMKQYYHANCLFEMFYKARATTKVIEEPGDIEDWSILKQEDKDTLNKLIEDLEEIRSKKSSGDKKTPKKRESTATTPKKTKEDTSGKEDSAEPSTKKEKTPAKPTNKASKEKEKEKKSREKEPKDEKSNSTEPEVIDEDSKYNAFIKFCKLCEVIASLSKYTDKSAAIKTLITNKDFDGDLLTWVRLLSPGTDQRVYNMKEKQIINYFSAIFDLNSDEVLDQYKNDGDVSITIRNVLEEKDLCKTKKSDWSIQKIDRWLTKLSSDNVDPASHIKFAAKRLSSLEIQYLIRLIKKDLRFNAGVKHILEGLHPSASEAFQSCRDLEEIINRYKQGKLNGGKGSNTMEVGIKLGYPVLPMLAEPCKSVAYAMKKCPNGMYAEIKYDGERVQVHKSGNVFTYYSRSLKPVVDHKIAIFKSTIPQAFPAGLDLILDAEVLMVDTSTGKPLPFGTLGVHKKAQFKDASVCLFIFDILRYNDENLTHRPLEERRKLLEANITEIPNRIVMSNYQKIDNGDNDKLKCMIFKAIDEGLEGLVVKDIKSVYEPGKRHWLKIKKDYLEEGSMADTADLLVLGAYFGTGSKGGMMSVFLMGVYDKDTDSYKTVTKCGNGHTDQVLNQINKDLADKMKRIDRVHGNVPSWLKCSRPLVPDFVMKDPKESLVWEITGAEFSKSDNHTAAGVSIRFPRVTRVRNDKDWTSATSLKELKKLYDVSKEKSDIDRSFEDNVPLYAKEDDKDKDIVAPGSSKQEEKGNKSDTKKDSVKQKVEKPKKNMKEDDGSGEDEKKVEAKKATDKLEKQKKRAREEDDSDGETRTEEKAPERKRSKEDSDREEDEEEEEKEKCPVGMTPCQYGASCYRKNPDHKRDFWHPRKK